jgi:hypothetical protein
MEAWNKEFDRVCREKDQAGVNKWLSENPEPADESTHYSCPSGHFGKDYPLIEHHPIHGEHNPKTGVDTKSRPGDSWCLTWIK